MIDLGKATVPVSDAATQKHSDEELSYDLRTSGEIDAREAIFEIRGVSKVYQMGEVEVHALRSVDLDLFRLESRDGGAHKNILTRLGDLNGDGTQYFAFRFEPVFYLAAPFAAAIAEELVRLTGNVLRYLGKSLQHSFDLNESGRRFRFFDRTVCRLDRGSLFRFEFGCFFHDCSSYRF
jgi:hypothetical protein